MQMVDAQTLLTRALLWDVSPCMGAARAFPQDKFHQFHPGVLGIIQVEFTPVGTGSTDWKAILAEAEKIGVEHRFVEQDETSGPPLEAPKTSYANLKKLQA